MSAPITYLRAGRMMRATGTVLEVHQDRRMTKVKPTRDGWGIVWLTEQEIEAGKEKPPIRPREKRTDEQPKPKRIRTPKPQPLTRWQQLVEHVRKCQSLGALYMDIADGVALADELEAAQTLFKTNADVLAPAGEKTPNP